MKAIRTYRFEEGNIIQETLLSALFDQEDSLDDPSKVSISCRVDPDGLPYLEDYPDLQIAVFGDTSLDILLDELQHFINALKLLYYGS